MEIEVFYEKLKAHCQAHPKTEQCLTCKAYRFCYTVPNQLSMDIVKELIQYLNGHTDGQDASACVMKTGTDGH